MKILVTLFISLLLHAQSFEVQVVKDLLVDGDEEFDSVEFVINRELGRAAVEITFAQDYGDDYWYRTERVLIEGLSYDLKAEQVVYNGIVCAQRKTTLKIFSYLDETGNCLFEIDEYQILADDGWNIKKKNAISVKLIILD